MSTATNLDPLFPSVTGQHIYRHDTQTSATLPNGQTTLVSKDELGIPATAGPSIAPVIAKNGAFVAFVSSATNLVTVPPAAPGLNVYVRAIP